MIEKYDLSKDFKTCKAKHCDNLVLLTAEYKNEPYHLDLTNFCFECQIIFKKMKPKKTDIYILINNNKQKVLK